MGGIRFDNFKKVVKSVVRISTYALLTQPPLTPPW